MKFAIHVLRFSYPVIESVSYLPFAQALEGLAERFLSFLSVRSFELLEMFADKSLMTVADVAGVVGEAPMGRARLIGVLYRIPEDLPEFWAKGMCLIEIDTEGLSSVFVPMFRLEVELGIKPKIFSSSLLGITLRARWASSGEAKFAVNDFALEDSMTTLKVANDDVVVSGKAKLASKLKTVAKLKAVAKVKAKAKANVGRVGRVAKRPARNFGSP